MSKAHCILCERGETWAVALRPPLQRIGHRLYETRSLEECWAEVLASPASLVGVEATAANLEQLVPWMSRLAATFPAARIIGAGRPRAGGQPVAVARGRGGARGVFAARVAAGGPHHRPAPGCSAGAERCGTRTCVAAAALGRRRGGWLTRSFRPAGLFLTTEGSKPHGRRPDHAGRSAAGFKCIPRPGNGPQHVQMEQVRDIRVCDGVVSLTLALVHACGAAVEGHATVGGGDAARGVTAAQGGADHARYLRPAAAETAARSAWLPRA